MSKLARLKKLKAPFPWFGGKSKAAQEVWAALGMVDAYVEPFGGSAAIMLAAPHRPKFETYNDLDGLMVNAWRSIKLKPEETAYHADWPVSELDTFARQLAMVKDKPRVVDALAADPEWCDPKIAGWWLWGIAGWIGYGWCSEEGHWTVRDGTIARCAEGEPGVYRRIASLGASKGVQGGGRGPRREVILKWFARLSERLERTRFACGDWHKVTTPATTGEHHVGPESVGYLFDPPYPVGGDRERLYGAAHADTTKLNRDVFRKAVELGRKGSRVVVCGYKGVWRPPRGWTERPWNASIGFATTNPNFRREVLWCSPGCLG